LYQLALASSNVAGSPLHQNPYSSLRIICTAYLNRK